MLRIKANKLFIPIQFFFVESCFNTRAGDEADGNGRPLRGSSGTMKTLGCGMA
jgi:hypothetical protein